MSFYPRTAWRTVDGTEAVPAGPTGFYAVLTELPLAARHQDELVVQVRDRALSYAEVIPVECYRTVD
jgi:hypothetical protein